MKVRNIVLFVICSVSLNFVFMLRFRPSIGVGHHQLRTIFRQNVSPLSYLRGFSSHAARSSSIYQHAFSSKIDSGTICEEARVKRKVALVVSYVGSNYYGLQLDPTSDLPFVETELKRALVEVGAILPSNSATLSRIYWSRSSRTDKGVHAARVVIGAKLEIPPSWLTPDPDMDTESTAGVIRIKPMVEALNSRLPPDIRVFSCVKMHNNFSARRACTWREYEYLLPARVLTLPALNPYTKLCVEKEHRRMQSAEGGGASSISSSTNNNESVEGGSKDAWIESMFPEVTHPPSQQVPLSVSEEQVQDEEGPRMESAIARLNRALGEMIGSHSFHNFNRMSGRDIRNTVSRKEARLAMMDDRSRDNNSDSSSNDSNNNSSSSSFSGSSCPNRANQAIDDHNDGTSMADTIPSSSSSSSGDNSSSTSTGKVNLYDDSVDIVDFRNYNDDWTPIEKELIPVYKQQVYHASATLLQPPHHTEALSHRNHSSNSTSSSSDSYANSAAAAAAAGLEGGSVENGEQMLRIRIRGSAFLLNQIRLMIGTAVAVTRGALPEDAIEAALLTPYRFNFPLVPAEGLFLDSAGFGINPNNSEIALSLATAGNPRDDFILMDEDEFSQSVAFNRNWIRPQIIRDWAKNDSLLLREWLTFAERFRPPREVCAHWHQLLHEQRQQLLLLPEGPSGAGEGAASMVGREGERVLRAIEHFQLLKARQNSKNTHNNNSRREASSSGEGKRGEAAIVSAADMRWFAKQLKSTGDTNTTCQGSNVSSAPDKLNDTRQSTSIISTSANNTSRAVRNSVKTTTKNKETKKLAKFVRRRDLLPTKFATDLTIHFDTAPGRRVDEALRALATQIATRRLQPDLTSPQLIALVERDGLDHWAFEQPKDGLIT
mmetsp:Transcript_15642/g.26113  ORF Transcript_15642/g.26113 Transcript_15642/m.26113 type:complete len:887 (+) Transcript_15642:105-2765(+)